MWFRLFRNVAVSVAALSLAASLCLFSQDSSHRGRKYKAPPPTSRVNVTILRDDDGTPIENAAVVFQLDSEKGNMELKTDEDGKAVIDVLPQGSKVTVQVVAKGFQTYGRDYTIDKAQMAIEVKLKRPGKQYSVYEDHSQAAKSDQDAESAKNSDKSSDDKKDTTKDQPSNSDKQSNSKPDSSQPQ